MTGTPDRGAREADRRAHRGGDCSSSRGRTRRFHGRYYQFDDVTIDPRPPGAAGGVGLGRLARSRIPGEHDVPKLATTVADRIVRAGNWISRCSGKQEWVKRDWEDLQRHAVRMGRDPEDPGVRALQLHAPRGDAEARAGGRGVQGAVHPGDGDAPELGAPAGVLHGRAPSTGSTRASPTWCPRGSSTWCSARSATTRSRSTSSPSTSCPPSRERCRPARGRPIKAVVFDIGGILEPPFDDVLVPELADMLGVSEPRLREHRAADAVALTEGRMTLRDFYARVGAERAGPWIPTRPWRGTWPSTGGDRAARRARPRADPARCGERHVVACLTNTEVEVGRLNRERGLFRPFDRAFLSTELGLHKPDRAIFERVLAELGCAPPEAVFTDDKLENAAGAPSGRDARDPLPGLRGLLARARASARAGALTGGRQVRRRGRPPPRGPALPHRRGPLRRRPPRGGLPPRGDPPEPPRPRADPPDPAGRARGRIPPSSRASPTRTWRRCSGRSRSPGCRRRRSRRASASG